MLRFSLPFATSFLLLALAAHAAGADDKKSKTPPPVADETTVSLHAIPVGAETLLKPVDVSTLAPANTVAPGTKGDPFWPTQALQGQQYFCKEYQIGCYLIGYTDSKDLSYFPFLKADLSTALAPEKGNQFFLQDYRYAVASQFSKGKDRENALSSIRTPEQIKADATAILARLRVELSGRGTLSPETEHDLLNHPAAFVGLSALYRDFLTRPDPRTSLESVIHKALWLSLEGLANSAYSGLRTFPRVNDASLTTTNFLNPDQSVPLIKKMRKQLPLISLTDDVRKSLSSECHDPEKPCQGFMHRNASGAFTTLAAYSPNLNAIYVDYTQDFYEAVYTLQHELRHALAENTKQAEFFRQQVDSIAPQLLDPARADDAAATLKQIIFYATIQNELNALSESNSLYRFSGQLTQQWGAKTPSAKAWYDAEYSLPEDRKLYIPLSERVTWAKYMKMLPTGDHEGLFKKAMIATFGSAFTGIGLGVFLIDKSGDASVAATTALRAASLAKTAAFTGTAVGWGSFVGYLVLNHYLKKHAIKVNGDKIQKLTAIKGDLDAATSALKKKLEEKIPPSVIEFVELFHKRYKLNIPNPEDFVQPVTITEEDLVEPHAVQLSCATAQKISELMPVEWEHGIPFYFEIIDHAPCNWSNGVQPGEGGGGGTHPDMSALPCLSGAE